MNMEKFAVGTLIVIVALAVLLFLSIGVKTIWFSPETEYINCMNYKHVDDLVICQERPVESVTP